MEQEPLNPDFRQAIEEFAFAMPIMKFIGLSFTKIEHGSVEIRIPYREELSYAPGSFQAGPIGLLMDVAACCAVGTKLPSGWGFSTIDFTTKIVAPANGDSFTARGRVVSSGKSISVGEARVYAVKNGLETLCATGLATTRNFEIKG